MSASWCYTLFHVICLSALSVVIRRDLCLSLFHFRVCQYKTVAVKTMFSCHYRILDSKALVINKIVNKNIENVMSCNHNDNEEMRK